MNTKKRCSSCRDFFPAESMLRQGLAGVCSDECLTALQNKARAKRERRKIHKAARLKYGRRLSGELRDKVKTRDAQCCRYCGVSGELQCHHVMYRSQGGPDRLSNLITLCPADHALMHTNKKLYQPALLLCLMMFEQRDVMLTVPQALQAMTGDDAEVLWSAVYEWTKSVNLR